MRPTNQRRWYKQGCSEEEAEAALAQLRAGDDQLPGDPGERQEYLDKRAAELARKITNQEKRSLGGRSLGEMEVRLCLQADPGLYAPVVASWRGGHACDLQPACVSAAHVACTPGCGVLTNAAQRMQHFCSDDDEGSWTPHQCLDTPELLSCGMQSRVGGSGVHLGASSHGAAPRAQQSCWRAA